MHGSASPSDRRPRRRAFFPGPGWALCLCVAFMFYFIFLAPCQHFMSSCKATEERRSMRDPSSIRISRTGAGISLPIRDQESSRYVNHIAATVNPRQPRKATRPIRHEATARRRQQPTTFCQFLILFIFLLGTRVLHHGLTADWIETKRPISVPNVDQMDVHNEPRGRKASAAAGMESAHKVPLGQTSWQGTCSKRTCISH